MSQRGGYVQVEGDPGWWLPSGKSYFSPDRSYSPAQELAHAKEHFFFLRRSKDVFSTDEEPIESIVEYDKYDLLVQETCDPFGNRVTAGERNIDPKLPFVRNGQNYRLLMPFLIMDANRNRTIVTFDILGMVVGSAVMGKPDQQEGDSLYGFMANLSEEMTVRHFDQPFAGAQDLLRNASNRTIYDYHAYYRTRDQTQPQPNWVSTLSRETHAFDLSKDETSKVFISFAYSDGFDRVIQQKVQAGAESVVASLADSDDNLKERRNVENCGNAVKNRWVGDGWIVYNNKGKPVRQFEPFSTDTHHFEDNSALGVSPIIFYDPLQRLVATAFPDHTWSKVILDPWHTESWDVNDTVLIQDPKLDLDVGDFFRRLPEADYFPSWYSQRENGSMGREARICAEKTAVHAGTPRTMVSDALGRMFVGFEIIRTQRSNSDNATNEIFRNHAVMDIQGNQHRIYDAEGRLVNRARYNYLGALIHHSNMENCQRWLLTDVIGKPIYSWDSRRQQLRSRYDKLRRLVDLFFKSDNGRERLVERSVYGESGSNPEAGNTRGRLIRIHDQAGITSKSYDFKGNTVSSQHQLAMEYRSTIDWAENVVLDPEVFKQTLTYDALNRIVTSALPDGSATRNTYDVRGLLKSVATRPRGAKQWTPVVKDTNYNVKGQRTYIAHGNGTTMNFTYDPLTFRLLSIVTSRNQKKFPPDTTCPPVKDWQGTHVQNLHYTYDPTGNITSALDKAQQTIFFRNQRVPPSQEFTYNSTYQLVEACGREHLRQAESQQHPSSKGVKDMHVHLDHPHDGRAMGRYVEQYYYDRASNILRMQHENTTSSRQWTRHYEYNELSFLEPTRLNNRLSRTRIGTVSEEYKYDGLEGIHGNMTSMPTIPQMGWNYRDQLQSTARLPQKDSSTETMVTSYRYDSTGKRVRKVTEPRRGEDQTTMRLKETLYIGGTFEIFRKYHNNGEIKLEVETTKILESTRTTLVIETKTKGENPKIPPELYRYQYSNQQGSVALELDDTGKIISYEEYTPYGNSSYQANHNQTEVPKRYRYVGKEKDDSGLYYQGARYYAAWLGRWISSDPKGLIDGLNLFVYAHTNPIGFADPTGTSAKSTLEHNKVRDAMAYLLKQAKIPGSMEVVVKAGKGGSRLDWLAKWIARGSVEVKTMNMFHYFENGELNVAKLNAALADHTSQVSRHTRHLRRFAAALGKVSGRESLVIVARGFAKASPEFAKFAEHTIAHIEKARGVGKAATAVFHRAEPEIKAALKAMRTGSNTLIEAGPVTKGLKTLLDQSRRATAVASTIARRGGQAGFATVGAMVGVLKVMGGAALAYQSYKDVETLAGNGPTGGKVDAGVDLAANALMASGIPPLEVAGGVLAAGGAVGTYVAPVVEAAVTKLTGSETVGAVVGAEAGVLAGAATGAAIGAAIGTVVPGLGTAVGAGIGGAVGAIGAAIRISWGN